jgi:undecaprenyl diphosphate synthase
MDKYNEELGLKIPAHVAVILDGNGRWAKKKHMPRTYGHMQGSKVVEDMLYVADDLGIQYFTVYAFSTENWKRSEEEVGTLMSILRKYLKDCVKKSMKNNVRCRVIGRREELSDDIVESINNLEEKTKNNTGLNFTIAINYGGRDEIVRAVQKIAQDVKEGKIAPEAIDEAMINANLDTKDIPDPDLLIRTSGEQRLSNYLPWQLAYTEFYFTDVDVMIVYGDEGLIEAATHKEADIVLTAVVGMMGIVPTIKAIEAHKDIALANKETLVTAGHIIMKLAKDNNVNIYPVDSEHSAIFQSLNGEYPKEVERILLTASGGPFRGKKRADLVNVTVEDALNHPNWAMGRKITIDSSTMVNKGLEVMEAQWLFNVPSSKVTVVVQPQSIIFRLQTDYQYNVLHSLHTL